RLDAIAKIVNQIAKTQKLPAKHINQGFFDPSTYKNMPSRSPLKNFLSMLSSFFAYPTGNSGSITWVLKRQLLFPWITGECKRCKIFLRRGISFTAMINFLVYRLPY
ncbi:hypothetical protein, partial [Komagataeibacter xylinus]